jgi:hypothetical protein
MATPRQLEANRSNAKRSTGPRSELGKERSRANSVLHGMAGSGIVLPDEEAEAVRRRMEAWRPSYRLGCLEDEWVYEQMVISTVRIDRCQKEGMAVRSTEASRAELAWEEERAREAETIGARLAKRPSIIAHELLRTTQGCDWLLGRWRALGEALQGEGEGAAWTDAQKSLAFDLLGVPTELRPESLPDDPRALVASEVERLECYQLETLESLDELERSAAELGLTGRPSRPESLVRRYEAASFKILQWTRTRLQECRGVAPAAAPAPAERVEALRPEPILELVPASAPIVVKPPEPEPEPAPPPAPVVAEPVDDHAEAVDQTGLDHPVVAVLAVAVSTGCASPAPAAARTWGNRRARKAAKRRAAR